jgi:hypothetical protein
MMGVSVSSTGKITATSDAIVKLRALCEQDARELGLAPPVAPPSPPSPQRRRPVVVETRTDRPASPQPDDEVVFRVHADDPVEVMVTDLMVKSYRAALRAFRLADEASRPGGSVNDYEVAADHAGRLTRAFADLVQAHDRRHGKGQQRIVVQHQHSIQAGRLSELWTSRGFVSEVTIDGPNMHNKSTIKRGPYCGWRCFDGVWRRVTPGDPEGLFSYRRPHRATGQPRGGRPGNRNAWKTGWRSRIHTVEPRKAFMHFLRQCREAAARAKRQD